MTAYFRDDRHGVGPGIMCDGCCEHVESWARIDPPSGGRSAMVCLPCLKAMTVELEAVMAQVDAEAEAS